MSAARSAECGVRSKPAGKVRQRPLKAKRVDALWRKLNRLKDQLEAAAKLDPSMQPIFEAVQSANSACLKLSREREILEAQRADAGVTWWTATWPYGSYGFEKQIVTPNRSIHWYPWENPQDAFQIMHGFDKFGWLSRKLTEALAHKGVVVETTEAFWTAVREAGKEEEFRAMLAPVARKEAA